MADVDDKRAQAEARHTLEREIRPQVERLSRSAAALVAQLRAMTAKVAKESQQSTSPTLIETLCKEARVLASDCAKIDTALTKHLREVIAIRDDELRFAGARPQVEALTRLLTDGKKALFDAILRAKDADAAAHKAIEGLRRDTGEARRTWAIFMAHSEASLDRAKRAFAQWQGFAANVAAAADERRHADLLKLRKSPPDDDGLRRYGENPQCAKRVRNFQLSVDAAAIDAAFAAELRTDMARMAKIDQTLTAWGEAIAMIAARVERVVIEPRDGRKAAGVLGLDGKAAARLVEALDGPDAALPRALDAIAKQFKTPQGGQEMLARLKSAGVV